MQPRYDLNKRFIESAPNPNADDDSWSFSYLYSFFASEPVQPTPELRSAQALYSQVERKRAWHTNTKDMLAAKIKFLREYRKFLDNMSSYKFLEPIGEQVLEFCKATNAYALKFQFVNEEGPLQDEMIRTANELAEMRRTLEKLGIEALRSIDYLQDIPRIIRDACTKLVDKECLASTMGTVGGFKFYDAPYLNEKDEAIIKFIYTYDRLQLEGSRLDSDTLKARKDKLQEYSAKLESFGIVPCSFVLKLEPETLKILLLEVNKKYVKAMNEMERLIEESETIIADFTKANDKVVSETQNAVDTQASKQILNSRKDGYRRV